jgi:hypothetical protein
VFVTSQGTAHGRFTRAIQRRNLEAAETAALELERLTLDDALQLVYLYAERRSPKYERAAIRWLERWLTESAPSLKDVATAAAFVQQLQR